MRTRLIAVAGSCAVATAVAALTLVPVAGQTPTGGATGTQAQAPRTGAPRPSAIKRLPDGRPDLQGTYDISTITPFERPQGATDTITEADAKTREQRTQTSRAAQNRASDGSRQAPPVGGDGSSGPYGNVGGYNQFWLDPGDTWITVDGIRRSSIVVDPPNGRVPRKPRAANAPVLLTSDAGENAGPTGRGAYDNVEQRPLADRCLLGFGSTSGPPSLPNGFYNNTKQIVQAPGYVMILNEMVHDARIVRMGGKHVDPSIRKWTGDSIGWWEGDTLVVETTNFTDKTRYAGSSPNLKVTERFSRLDEKNLLYRFTIDDPATFTQPWSGEFPWRPADGLLYEYACHEGNYAMGNILRGARLLEKEADEIAAQQKK